MRRMIVVVLAALTMAGFLSVAGGSTPAGAALDPPAACAASYKSINFHMPQDTFVTASWCLLQESTTSNTEVRFEIQFTDVVPLPFTSCSATACGDIVIGPGTVPPGTSIINGACNSTSSTVECDIGVSVPLSCVGVGSSPPITFAQFPLTLQADAARGNPDFTSRNQTFQLQCTPTITTTSLPDAHKNTTYQQQLTAVGGQGSYSWDVVAGRLPNGITLSSDGLLVGLPGVLETETFTVRVTESVLHNSATATYTVAIKPNPLQILIGSLPDGVLYGNYVTHMLSTGGDGPPRWDIMSGSLPAGITMDSAGNFSGTPTAAGTSQFTTRVTDGDTTDTRPLSITIDPMTITTGTLPPAIGFVAYKQTLTESGGRKAWTWKVAAGSVLPKGLTLSTAGVLSGTPSVIGSFTATIQVTDGARPADVATKTFTITVLPMMIATTGLPAAPIGRTYSTTLKTLGGKAAFKWVVSIGTLPAGLKLATGGQLTGTPTAAGTSTFTVKVTDSAVPQEFATATYSLTVTPMLITTTALPAGTVKKAYSAKLAFSGGKGTLTSVVSAGALPPGVHLATTGAFSGTPTAAGSYTFTVTSHDASKPANTATATFTLTIG